MGGLKHGRSNVIGKISDANLEKSTRDTCGNEDGSNKSGTYIMKVEG